MNGRTTMGLPFRFFRWALVASAHLFRIAACRFLIVDCSKCPLFVAEGHTHPSAGLPLCSHRVSRMKRNLGERCKTLRAEGVLPDATNRLPLEPLPQLICSQRIR